MLAEGQRRFAPELAEHPAEVINVAEAAAFRNFRDRQFGPDEQQRRAPDLLFQYIMLRRNPEVTGKAPVKGSVAFWPMPPVRNGIAGRILLIRRQTAISPDSTDGIEQVSDGISQRGGDKTRIPAPAGSRRVPPHSFSEPVNQRIKPVDGSRRIESRNREFAVNQKCK